VNARSVTVGDYAAVITGLGTNDFTREDLAQFMAHYGEVASVVYTKNIGTLLTAEHRLSHARLRLHELRAWRDGAAAGGEGSGGGVLGALYRRLYLGSSTSYSDHDVVGSCSPKASRKPDLKPSQTLNSIQKSAIAPIPG